MFDIGWSEMLVIAIVIIVVVGPKELPGMLRTFGRTTSKLRVMANDFRKQFDDAIKEAELDDLKKLADDARSLNPANQIKQALSPLEEATRDVRAGLDQAMRSTPDTASSEAPADLIADEGAVASQEESPVKAAMTAAVAKANAAAKANHAAAQPVAAVAEPAPAAVEAAPAVAKSAAAEVAKAPAKPKAPGKPKAAAAKVDTVAAAKPKAAAAKPAAPPKSKTGTAGTKAKAGGAKS